MIVQFLPPNFSVLFIFLFGFCIIISIRSGNDFKYFILTVDLVRQRKYGERHSEDGCYPPLSPLQHNASDDGDNKGQRNMRV